MRYRLIMTRPPAAPSASPPESLTVDPVGRIRAADAAPKPARFWREVAVELADGGFCIHLDGRPARTPGRRILMTPGREAADRLAAEWRSVGERLDPARMPLTRLVNSALDGVADHVLAVRADIVKYAGSDLLCYRAAEPPLLVARQRELWDPVLVWARDALGARFSLAEGVMFVEQPREALAAVARAVDMVPAPHQLAALHVATSLTGSAILALALARRALAPEAAWAAAHVDEDAQMEIWGRDDEALAARALKRRDFDAAATLLQS